MGLAAVTSYKVIPLLPVLGVLLLLRDRWSHRASWLGLGAGALLAGSAALALDRLVYGEWALSLPNYLVYNVLAHDPVHGQHLGILLIEFGVGTTVAAVMITIFYNFAGRGREEDGE